MLCVRIHLIVQLNHRVSSSNTEEGLLMGSRKVHWDGRLGLGSQGAGW